MMEPPRSQQFDDVYFSAEDGLAETRHVFLEGNGLPGRWQGRARFCIAETGFGTGLNFLAAWKLFDETAPAGAFLDYISVEKYPLARGDIERGLAHWPELKPWLSRFLAQYPLRTAGYHRMVFDGRVALTLIFDDANDALPALDARVDAWFLDGFTPAKNPLMWTQTVFDSMARLGAPGATFATFTAAGDVKRGLAAAGFKVEKHKGFGRKRDMLAGCLPGIAENPPRASGRVAIIGGGMAGAACAHVLPQYGFTPVLYESESALASGASGNRCGLYNPRFTAFRGPESEFYVSAFALAYRTFATIGDDIAFHPCGALHLITDDDKAKRFPRTLENWGWHGDHMRLVDAPAASDIAGVSLRQEALYLPDSGTVDPVALCRVYTKNTDVHLSAPATDGDGLAADHVIMAAGPGMLSLVPDLPLETVRGQVSAVANALPLKTALCYGGYIAPDGAGGFMLGSTFQKWRRDTDIDPADHEDNRAKLTAAVPALAGLAVRGGRAALRTASKDRFPVAGAWSDRILISTAYGSHGIIGALLGAHLLADILRGGPFCLPRHSRAALSPARFRQSG